MYRVSRGAKEYARYLLPTTGAMLSFSVYTMAMGAVVSHGEGEAALAALNLSMPLINLMFAVSVLLSVGASTAIGVYKGKADTRLANRAFTQDVLAVIAAALFFTLVTSVFPRELAVFFGGTGEMLDYVIEYVRVSGAFAITYMLSYNLEVMVRADGRPNMSFAGVFTCGLVTVGLGYLFVARMGLGLRGAAFAGGLGQLSSVLVYLTHFLSKRAKLKLAFARPIKGFFRHILPLGLSDFSNEIALALTTFLYNRVLLLAVGEQGVVSYAVVSYINTLVVMLLAGVTQGGQPLVSRSRGARDPARMLELYGYEIKTAIAFGLFALLSSTAFAKNIVPLLLEGSSETAPYTERALRMFAVAFPLMGVNIVTAGFLASTEASGYAIIISTGRGLMLAIALYTLAVLNMGDALWFAAAMAEGVCAIASVLLLRRRKRELCSPAAGLTSSAVRCPKEWKA